MTMPILLTFLIAAPMPKDPPPGPPMSTEQVLLILKEKGELTWNNGSLRLKVKKVDDLDLVEIELRVMKAGKVESTLTGKKGRIKINKDAGTLALFCDEGTLTRADIEAEYFGQDWEFPAPRLSK